LEITATGPLPRDRRFEGSAGERLYLIDTASLPAAG
jgi:hypothetical protein